MEAERKDCCPVCRLASREGKHGVCGDCVSALAAPIVEPLARRLAALERVVGTTRGMLAGVERMRHSGSTFTLDTHAANAADALAALDGEVGS